MTLKQIITQIKYLIADAEEVKADHFTTAKIILTFLVKNRLLIYTKPEKR